MVSGFTLMNTQTRKAVYLYINEEGGTLSTNNYIWDGDDFTEDMMIDYFDVNTLSKDDDNYELYVSCFIEYVKHDCLRSGGKYHVRWEMLTPSLQQQVSPAYKIWHEQNEHDDYETDGYQVFISDAYKKVINRNTQQAVELLQWIEGNEEWWDDADKRISIGFMGKSITLDYEQGIMNNIKQLLNELKYR